jgi:hypothetical protein
VRAGSGPSAKWRWLPLPWVGAMPTPPRVDTWRLGCLSFCGVRPASMWRWAACLVPRAKGQTRCGAGAKIIMFFSINTFNDNKHNNLCTPNNNIFDINSLNYKKMNIITFNYNKNKNIYTANNNIFDINDLNYNRNSNIYNTNNSTNINNFNYNKNNNIYGINNNNNNNNNF